MAMVDVNYTSSHASMSDATAESQMGKCRIMSRICLLREPSRVVKKKGPFVIVADDAFPLGANIMKPYPLRNQPEAMRIFNYRLS